MEEFKEIIIYDKVLLVSNFGRVFLNDVEMKYHYNKDGYKRVSINNRTPSVHILVAKAFIENDDLENKKEVNHKDFDRSNARYDNLEWVTHQENVEYSKINGRYKGKSGENNPNYQNDTLRKKYLNNPELAIEKQSRKGTKNGRCIKVDLYIGNDKVKTFDYFEECLVYINEYFGENKNLGGMRSSINRCIRNNKDYRGFTIIKH